MYTAGGQFPTPGISSEPLLSIRCAQAVRPYLPEDMINSDPSFVSILIDTPVTYSRIAGASPVHLSKIQHSLEISISIEGKTLTKGSVPLNATKHALPFFLASLKPRAEAYNVACSATLGSQKFTASSLLTYLPAPPSEIGSVTKMDMRTGALLARPATGSGGPYEALFPIGFYTDYDGYLATNMSVIAELKSQG